MSQHMNAFNPYQKNNEHHEDHLTRGFLLLLKYSPMIFYSFHDYIRQEYEKLNKLEDFSSLFGQKLDYSITTQVGCEKASNYLKSNILSILITDEALEIDDEVGVAQRRAIYDGIISINDDWTLIIENKPYHGNVWTQQLSTGEILGNKIEEQGLNLIKTPIVLKWRDIFKRLTCLECSNIEQAFIKDFYDFVFQNYPTLFPYETFEQCNKNKDLLDIKIEKLLRDIIKDEFSEKIKPHTSWAKIIELEYDCINQIDYRADIDGVRLYFYYGINVPKSKNLFQNYDLKNIKNLQAKGWDANFHIRIADAYGRSISSILCKNGMEDDFVSYWRQHTVKIGKKNIDDFNKVLQEIKLLNFADFEKYDEFDLGKRTQISIMPALSLKYNFDFDKLYALEKNPLTLKQEFIEKSKEGLSIIKKDVDFDKIINETCFTYS